MSLSVSDLSYSFSDKRVLDDIGFEIEAGQFCALLGPNGAGKSTLFALLTRLYTVPTGSIRIAGHDLRSDPLAALGSLGVVFQSPTLDLDLSVMRNLTYFAALHGISGRLAMERGEEALARLEMADRAGEKVRNLNGGHRRRVEIARALMHRPKVLLLDEPTVGLDAGTRAAITGHVHSLARDGMTVFWATHLTDEIWPDDRLLVLHRGRLLHDGLASDLSEPPGLTERFLQMTGETA